MSDINKIKRFWDVDDIDTAKYKRVASNNSQVAWSKDNADILINKYLLFGGDISSKKILDFGCGVGRIIKHISRYSDQCYGLDISEKMIEYAIDYVENEKVKLSAYDGQSFPYQDNFFDLIYTFHVLQHIPRKSMLENTISEIIRVLNTDGFAVLHFIGKVSETDKEAGGFSGYRPSKHIAIKICEGLGGIVKKIDSGSENSFYLTIGKVI